jgi:hypothetical protein
VDQIIVDDVLGKQRTPVDKPLGYYDRDVEEEKAFSRRAGKDNITFSLRPPIFPAIFTLGKRVSSFMGRVTYLVVRI